MDAWWGEQTFELGQTRHWQIGPLDLWISRLEAEWRVAARVQRSPRDGSPDPPSSAAVSLEAPDARVRRFAAGGHGLSARVVPALPDRPLVVRPVKPISVLPSGVATLHVSMPLWIRIFVEGDARPVIDEAVLPPSDTWFGPDTTQGSLCYASRTHARLRLEGVEPAPHRAVTAIKVENRSNTTLEIERTRVPAANLSLYADQHSQLWTDELTLRQDDRSGAEVAVAPRSSTGAKLTRLAEPRAPRSKGSLFDAFSGRLVAERSHV